MKFALLLSPFFTLLLWSNLATATPAPLNFTVNMSEAVNVDVTGGTPYIRLDVGGVTRDATFASGSGTAALTFTYTPVAGDVDLDGISIPSAVVVPNGGTITDLNGNPETNFAFSAPNLTNVKVNYPSLSMDFVYDADGRYTLNGTAYDTLSAFLTAAGGSYTRASVGTYFDSTGTLQTASSNTPRFDHDPVTHVAKGILIEEQRANLFKYSSQLDNAAWSKTGAVVTADLATSPDGLSAGEKLIGNNGVTTRKAVYQAISATAGTKYTFSVFLKKAEFTTATIWFDETYITEGAYYGSTSLINLNTGISSNPAITTVTSVGNGWYRCSVTATPSSTATLKFTISAGYPNGGDYTGDGTSGIYVWGAQIEQGAFPTSYIPTTSAAVTRLGDALTIPTGGWYNQAAGTSFGSTSWVSSAAVGNSYPMLWRFDDGTANNRWNLFFFTGGPNAGSDGFSGGVFMGGHSNSKLYSDSIKHAMSQSLNSMNSSYDGQIKNLDTTWTPPSVTRLTLSDNAGAAKWIRQYKYYPLRVTDTQLQLLSQ